MGKSPFFSCLPAFLMMYALCLILASRRLGGWSISSSHLGEFVMAIEPLAIGVCSWSLQVKSVPDLRRLLDRLGLTLDDLKCANLKVNFEPGNMLLYVKGYRLRSVELLGPEIRSVHVKDADRPPKAGVWGDEVPLGQGQVNIKAFVQTLKKVGYRGALCIEREVGDQEGRLADVAYGAKYLRECLA